jgi:hypothetical protein
VTREIVFKGYKRHACKEEPQYIIKSDKKTTWRSTKGRRSRRAAANSGGRVREAVAMSLKIKVYSDYV